MTTTTIRITLPNETINAMLEEIKAELSISEQEDFSQSTLYSTPGGLWVNVSRKRTFSDRPWPSESEVQIYPARPVSVDAIRREIARLEGELARISGEPLVISDERGRLRDIPPGGATLEWAPPVGTGFVHWFSTAEQARAALLKFAREHESVPEADGWSVDISSEVAQFSNKAWVTRREENPVLWVVNPMLDIRNSVDVYLDREEALARCEDHERLRGVRVSPLRVRPGDPSYERHLASLKR